MEILDKNFVSFTHSMKIKHGLGDNILLTSRFIQNLEDYFSKNGYIVGVDFDLFMSYGEVVLSSNNEKLILLAKLVFA